MIERKPAEWEPIVDYYLNPVRRIGDLDIPVIARLHGDTVGGGLGLAIACDFRIAAEAIRLGAPFVRIGLAGCDMSAGYYLPRLIPFGVATEMMMTGKLARADPRSAFASGVARAAFEATLTHAGTRVQFGQPIGLFQAVRFGIAGMAVQIEAARLLCHRAAIAADRGLPHGREASMAKLYAAEACTRIVERALHYHGAAGFVSESPIQRFYRDCKVLEFGEVRASCSAT